MRVRVRVCYELGERDRKTPGMFSTPPPKGKKVRACVPELWKEQAQLEEQIEGQEV